MATKISDRLLGLWNQNTTGNDHNMETPSTEESYQRGGERLLTGEDCDRQFDSLLSPTCRNRPCAVLGLVRLSSWNLHSQTSFADFCTKVASCYDRRVLAVSPWASSAPILNQRKVTKENLIGSSPSMREPSKDELEQQNDRSPQRPKDYSYFSLEAALDRVEPTGVSQLLRDLPQWKKQHDIVLLDLGIVGQPVSQSLANWCDAIYLLSNDSDHKRYSMAARQIDHWKTSGFRLDAAVHVA